MPLIDKPLQASFEETEKTDILFTRFAAKHLHFWWFQFPFFPTHIVTIYRFSLDYG